MNILPTIDSVDLTGKKILVREDLNVPIENGRVVSAARIQAAVINLKQILSKNPKQIIIISHLGKLSSLLPVVEVLTKLLNEQVDFIPDWYTHGIKSTAKLVLCENLRLYPEEEANSVEFAKYLASLAEVFVMDAFATAHREHASIIGVPKYIPYKAAGALLEQELIALNNVMQNYTPPVLAIVGGAKVSTKLKILEFLLKKVDILILGGGIANTFLLASGFNIGDSLVEVEFVSQARTILEQAKLQKKQILLPQDVIVANEISATAKSREVKLSSDKIDSKEKILDIGNITSEYYRQAIMSAKTILWNGPLGVFELDNFANGTKSLAYAIANSTAYSVAGGGDTIAAIEKFKLQDKISYISTGGGAFLTMLEGKNLPGVQALL